MSQLIIIQVGQCGNQIGSCLHPEIIQEYSEASTKNKKNVANLSSFFTLSSKASDSENIKELLGKKAIKAKVICIDMEERVVSRFRTSKFRDIFDKKCMITNHPGSANNWAEGYCSHGPKFKKKILNSVQYLAEKCGSLHAFLLLFSVGGGTGSGLGTYILKLLADYYPKVETFVTCVYASGSADVITCPYNMVFATQEFLHNATCVFPIENRALLDIASRETNRYVSNKRQLLLQPFEDINQIIVDMLLHLTSGARFPGCLNLDLNEINTNMVPFPKLHFLSSGISPFSFPNSSITTKQSRKKLFVSSISAMNQLVKINPILDARSSVLSAVLLARGDYNLDDMRSYVDHLQSKSRFAPWSRTAVKTAFCSVPPVRSDFAMLSLWNTTSMTTFFEKILGQFKRLYQRKAHVHHYTNVSGFDLDHFKNCENGLIDIVEMYKTAACPKTTDISGINYL